MPAMHAAYRLSWSGVTAARCAMDFSTPKPNVNKLELSARTAGVVRAIWSVDAQAFSLCDATSFRPIRVREAVRYRKCTTLIAQEFTPHDVLRIKENIKGEPPADFLSEAPADAAHLSRFAGKPAKRTSFENLYDMHSALLYLRSQPLANGDKLHLVIYQDNWPYFATVRVMGRSKATVAAGMFPAIKLELTAHYINARNGLETHRKFKRAVAWLSDDKDRLLLAAQADVFVGSIWAELESVTRSPAKNPTSLAPKTAASPAAARANFRAD